jgi:hypothetical protein
MDGKRTPQTSSDSSPNPVQEADVQKLLEEAKEGRQTALNDVVSMPYSFIEHVSLITDLSGTIKGW